MSEKHKQVAAQCNVIVHLATAIAQVHSDKARLMAENAMPTLGDLVGKNTACLMEELGNILNGMDAATGEDDGTHPVLGEARPPFAGPEIVEIPRPPHEALIAGRPEATAES